MLKKVISAAVAALLLLSAGVFGYAADDDNNAVSVDEAVIYVSGVKTDANARIMGETVNLPVRKLGEILGYTVGWSSEDGVRLITAVRDKDSIAFNLDSQSVTQNGHTYYLSSNSAGDGCFLYNGTTYLESGLFSEIFGVRAKYHEPSGMVEVTAEKNNPITVTTVSLSTEDDYFKLTLQYPQIAGLESAEAESSINSVFAEAASAAVQQGLSSTYDNIDIIKQYPDDTNKCETYLNYRITYNQNGLLCVSLFDYQYMGGAHGMTAESSYTFDLKTGKALKLSDLMNSTAAYTPFMSSAIRAEIDKRVATGNLAEFEGGKFTSIGDDPDFRLTDGALVIYFQQYEYFPYAAGIQEFPISYSDLKSMLKASYSYLYDEAMRLAEGTQNTLALGDTACVSLGGNPTTGYSWYCTIGDTGVLAPVSDTYTPDSELTGSGGTFLWHFKALKAGETTITFKYYRSWEGEATATAENTVVYQITVK